MVIIEDLIHHSEVKMGRKPTKQTGKKKKEPANGNKAKEKKSKNDPAKTPTSEGNDQSNDVSPKVNITKDNNEEKESGDISYSRNCDHCSQSQKSDDARGSPDLEHRRQLSRHRSEYRSREERGRSADQRDTHSKKKRTYWDNGDVRERPDSRETRSSGDKGDCYDPRDSREMRSCCDRGDCGKRWDSRDRDDSQYWRSRDYAGKQFQQRHERERWQKNGGHGYHAQREYHAERYNYGDYRPYDRPYSGRFYDRRPYNVKYEGRASHFDGNQQAPQAATTSKENTMKMEETTKNLEKEVGQVKKTVSTVYQMLKYGNLLPTPTPSVPLPTPPYSSPAIPAYNYQQHYNYQQPNLPMLSGRQHPFDLNTLDFNHPQLPFSPHVWCQAPPLYPVPSATVPVPTPAQFEIFKSFQ